ncbi:MAG: copper resistance CopC family protein, partial [Candidatus Promineifilaceae bacterium]
MKKHLHAIVLLVMGLLMLPTVSYAHLVELLSSFPENGTILSQSPGVITAVFNEEIQSATSNLQVFDADGNQIDNGDGGIDLNDPNHASMRVNLPTLAPGAYTVR